MERILTINQAIDRLFQKYTFNEINSNPEIKLLYEKLSAHKHMLGGKQRISPEGELMELLNKYIFINEIHNDNDTLEQAFEQDFM